MKAITKIRERHEKFCCMVYHAILLITTLCIFDSETGLNAVAYHYLDSGDLVQAFARIQIPHEDTEPQGGSPHVQPIEQLIAAHQKLKLLQAPVNSLQNTILFPRLSTLFGRPRKCWLKKKREKERCRKLARTASPRCSDENHSRRSEKSMQVCLQKCRL